MSLNYIELINRFWQEVEIEGFLPSEACVYFRLLDVCNKLGWQNPFSLSNVRAVALMGMTEKSFRTVRDKLVSRGLISFRQGSRREKAPEYCFPISIDGEIVFPWDSKKKKEPLQDVLGVNFTAKREVKTTAKREVKREANATAINKLKHKQKQNISDDIDAGTSASTNEEGISIARFDSFIQDVFDGKLQVWEDSMRIKFGIEDVKDYLPSFRQHAIATGNIDKILNIRDFRFYFQNSYEYFTKQRPIEVLAQYTREAKSEDYKKFCNFLKDKAPNAAAEMIPLSEDEFWKLKGCYDSQKIGNAVLEINNREYKFYKRNSLLQTIKSYLANEYNKS